MRVRVRVRVRVRARPRVRVRVRVRARVLRREDVRDRARLAKLGVRAAAPSGVRA